jgi:hypothetical protein
MNVLLSIVYMDFTMNVNEDIILSFGKLLQIALTAFLSQPLLMRKSSARTVDYHLN